MYKPNRFSHEEEHFLQQHRCWEKEKKKTTAAPRRLKRLACKFPCLLLYCATEQVYGLLHPRATTFPFPRWWSVTLLLQLLLLLLGLLVAAHSSSSTPPPSSFSGVSSDRLLLLLRSSPGFRSCPEEEEEKGQLISLTRSRKKLLYNGLQARKEKKKTELTRIWMNFGLFRGF